ncbi:hypothetical protein [Streptomyces sp. NPDC021622]|uniref:hypothetical protein n=1 Tax=Streptomyces sp. NPDC021622 TaxID=3155013 RepID=UPI0033C872F8
MDQGLAAVLGAGVGVLGTLGTAALTYAATRRQAMDHGRVQHWQQLRDERKETYLALLSALEDFMFESGEFLVALKSTPSSELVTESQKTAGDRLTDVYRQCQRVDISGPSSMADLATKLRSAATRSFGYLDAHVRNETRLTLESVRKHSVITTELAQVRGSFVEEARRLLETFPSQ